MTDLYVKVHGRVQGVGFRFSVARLARSHDLTGWVRNLPDGTVEVRARGAAENVAELTRWLHHGPPGARIDRVESLPVGAAPPGQTFDVRL